MQNISPKDHRKSRIRGEGRKIRDKLTQIVKESLVKNIDYSCKLAENITDDLLANGVIVPPCKVGQTVYQTDGVRVYESTIKNVVYETESIAFDERAIGRSIFLTREEVEKALGERRNEKCGI